LFEIEIVWVVDILGLLLNDMVTNGTGVDEYNGAAVQLNVKLTLD